MNPETSHELPPLTSHYELTPQQISQFQNDGHSLIKGLASDEEIQAYRPAIVSAVQRLNKENRPLEDRDTYGKAFLQISNVWESDEKVRRFTLAKRFADVAAKLLGVERVRIYHDQALFKEPGGGHTPWHQDQIYWPLDTSNVVTMWMPLVHIPQHVGSMTFATGSHKHGYINKMTISDESHKTLKSYIESKELPQMNYGAMAAGDATFHYGWTLHSAPENPTDQMREVMTVIYFADGTRVLEPDSNARQHDLKRWMPGLNPGDLAASHLNPLV